MNITEILTQAQQSSDAVTDLLIELAQQNKEVTATAQHMCDLYFADVRLREKGIRDMVFWTNHTVIEFVIDILPPLVATLHRLRALVSCGKNSAVIKYLLADMGCLVCRIGNNTFHLGKDSC